MSKIVEGCKSSTTLPPIFIVIMTIRELVVNTVSASLMGSGINCEFYIPDDLFPVNIDASQIRQVIRNIIINATEAMNGKGIIKVFCEQNCIMMNHFSVKSRFFRKHSHKYSKKSIRNIDHWSN